MEGFYGVKAGMDQAISRGLSYAPYADVVWCETSEPDLEQAQHFADAIHEKHPGKLLAYNCSPSFNWKKKLSEQEISRFQEEIGDMGYRFQFVTLAGFHALNYSMFDLARNYKERGMDAYSELQQAEFAAEEHGYTATKHQREVGAGYFDEVAQIVAGGAAYHGPHRLDRGSPVRQPGEPCHRPPRLHRERTVREVGFRIQVSGSRGSWLPSGEEQTMPNEPQDRSPDRVQQFGEGPDRTTPEEVAEPGLKRTAADTEWLSMATADPAHFLKDPDSK